MHDFFASFLTQKIFTVFSDCEMQSEKKALKISTRSTAEALEVKSAQCQNDESVVCLEFSTFKD